MVIEAARDAGMLVVAEGGSLYNLDMNLVADGSTGIEHNIPTLTIYDDVRDFWSQTDVGYTPTLVVTYGGLRQRIAFIATPRSGSTLSSHSLCRQRFFSRDLCGV